LTGAIAVAVAAIALSGVAATLSAHRRPSGADSTPPGTYASAVSTPTTAVPEPTTSVPAAPADPFGSDVASYLSTRGGSVMAALIDLESGRTWSIGDGVPQATGSMVKVDILETLLAGETTGGLPPPADQALASAMIELSTNKAAQALYTQLGGPDALADYNSAVGLTDTTPTWVWGDTTTVPVDQLALLRTLTTMNSHLTTAQRDYALGLMEHVTAAQDWGVSGGVPSTVTVALKNGWVPLASEGGAWQVDSMGWVDGQGRDYLLAVMTTRNPTLGYGEDTIDAVSAMIWQATAPQGAESSASAS
jgi:hypothetical protein